MCEMTDLMGLQVSVDAWRKPFGTIKFIDWRQKGWERERRREGEGEEREEENLNLTEFHLAFSTIYNITNLHYIIWYVFI